MDKDSPVVFLVAIGICVLLVVLLGGGGVTLFQNAAVAQRSLAAAEKAQAEAELEIARGERQIKEQEARLVWISGTAQMIDTFVATISPWIVVIIVAVGGAMFSVCVGLIVWNISERNKLRKDMMAVPEMVIEE